MNGPIETKVSLPAIVVGALGGIVAALYGCALAYDWLQPSEEQAAALAGLGAAALYALHVAIGYLAPHTPRADGHVTAQGLADGKP